MIAPGQAGPCKPDDDDSSYMRSSILDTCTTSLHNGWNRSTRQFIQQTCADRLAESLTPTEVTAPCEGVDKIFCSTWLDHDHVLVGSKCNKLTLLHLPSLQHTTVPYPEQPLHRQGPDLLAQSNRAHCGQHSLAVSPSGRYLVTGGTAAEDVLLWRLDQGSPDSSTLAAAASNSRSRSRLQMQPVRTYMGHADWVFGLDWISDRHWVSCGRDSLIKLWQVPQEQEEEQLQQAGEAAAAYDSHPGAAQLSVRYHAARVRALKFDQEQQHLVTMCSDGTLSWWTPDMQLKGSCWLHSARDMIAVATAGNTVAVGYQEGVRLLDTRMGNRSVLSTGGGSDGQASKRRRLVDEAAAGSIPHATGTAAAAGGGGVDDGVDDDEEEDDEEEEDEPWVTQAPGLGTLSRPCVSAVSSKARQLQEDLKQQLGKSRAADAAKAAQLLRMHAASTSVSTGQPFDAVLERLVGSLLKQPLHAQQQQLTQLQQLYNYIGPDPEPEQEAAVEGQHSSSRQPESAWNSFATLSRQPLPNQIRYILERTRNDFEALTAAIDHLHEQLMHEQQRHSQQHHHQAVKRQRQQEAAVVRSVLEARMKAELTEGKDVRSVSLQHQHLLGVGRDEGILDLYDLRRIDQVVRTYQPDLPPELDAQEAGCVRQLHMQSASTCTHADPDLVAFGFTMFDEGVAVHTHCWDPSGTRLLAAGGALSMGCKGAFISVWT